MRTRPLEHELTVPSYRWPRRTVCITPDCTMTVRVPGEFCRHCEAVQQSMRRALKQRRTA